MRSTPTLVLLVSAATLSIVTPIVARELSFEDRVAAQRAIEQVYWNHRIWPGENQGPKPPLSSVMPDAAIHAKVADYLKKSNALKAIWRRPITAGQLQAELDRMTTQSRDPQLLQEIFAALGNDPFVIAETLARPALADRLIHNWYAFDDRFHGKLKARANAALASCRNASCMKTMGGTYRETTWKLRGESAALASRDPGDRALLLDEDEWEKHLAQLATRVGGTTDALPLRTRGALEETADAFVVTAVLAAGEDRVTTAATVWEKVSFDSWWGGESATQGTTIDATSRKFVLGALNSSGCTPDTWTSMQIGAPNAVQGSVVWTGVEMIVWGGPPDSNTGGRYNPATDSWTPTSTGAGVPSARTDHTAVWSGTEMIIWGGGEYSSPAQLDTGGRYDPVTDTWTATSTGTGVPEGRSYHTAVWTGTEMIVWGGMGWGWLNTGGRYDPATDTWTATSTGDGVPSVRVGCTAVWTGSQMIVWGGGYAGSELNTGGRYDPSTDTWTETSTGAGVPTRSSGHTAVWTGTEMIVWGGSGSGWPPTGGRYNPASDTWSATSTGTGVPEVYQGHTAVWTGTEMIVWGGGYGAPDTGGGPIVFNTGGRYDPATDAWTATSTGPGTPLPMAGHAAVWTGTEMIIWGWAGVGGGGLYCACGGGSVSSWYPDTDGDGYGVSSTGIPSCTQPPGYAAAGGDCNDSAGAIHPGATETCNGIDDDCDGIVDGGGSALCDDGNSCTDDTCEGANGCAHFNNTVACSDGNACTVNDRCSDGTCVGGNAMVCTALDQCHLGGACDPGSGICSNPSRPDGTVCTDDDLCTTGDACRAGVCTPAGSGLNEPNPRTNGYYKSLCHGPHSGDQLTDDDAVCVAHVTATFVGISTVAQICEVIQPSHPNNDPCGKTEDDLIVLALNICRGRVCTQQSIDSQCGSNGSVGQSLAESDAILDSPSRNADTCGHAKCLDEEINTGRALELNTLTLRLETGNVRLSWQPPYLNDGSGVPSRYRVWRRPLGSLLPFATIGEAREPSFLDTASGSDGVEYEITAVLQ